MLSKISVGTLKSWEEDELLMSLLVLTALKADARAIDDAMAIAAAAADRCMIQWLPPFFAFLGGNGEMLSVEEIST